MVRYYVLWAMNSNFEVIDATAAGKKYRHITSGWIGHLPQRSMRHAV